MFSVVITLPLPDLLDILPNSILNLELDEIVVVYLVYNGDDPRKASEAFAAFEAVPALLDTRKSSSYSETASFFDVSSSLGATLAHHTAYRLGDERAFETLNAARQFSEEMKGLYSIGLLEFEPISKSLTDASRAAGGNLLDLPDGPYVCECQVCI